MSIIYKRSSWSVVLVFWSVIRMRTKDSWVLPVVVLAELRKASSALL